jgi:hypothetical protein
MLLQELKMENPESITYSAKIETKLTRARAWIEPRLQF